MDIILSVITATSIIKFTIESVEFIQNEDIREEWRNRIRRLFLTKVVTTEDNDEWINVDNDEL